MKKRIAPPFHSSSLFVSIVLVGCLLGTACSINQMAINAVSKALSSGGGSDTFTSDSDPELVGDAMPFAIKMYEALLAANPGHQGLRQTTGSLFVMYANAFVQGPSELLPRTRYDERQAGFERAKKLYLRGADILYQGLDQKYPGFAGAFQNHILPEILAKMKKDDVPSLYWAAAGGLSAYSLNPFDMDLGVRVPEYRALIDRAYKLDPDFNSGALDDFYVLFHASVPAGMGGDKSQIEPHHRLAIEKSGGRLAGPYVSYAQAVSIPAQDYEAFKTSLDAALAIDPDGDHANRLVNIIMLRKARFLLDSAALYFIDFDDGEDWD